MHDRFRGFSGSFKRTMEVVQRVADAGLALQVNTTVTRHNLSTLKALPELIAAAGAVPWSVLFLVPTGRGRVADRLEHGARRRSPCSTCHTPDGVGGRQSQQSNLFNVGVSSVGGQRQFIDTGRRSGSCTLTCHNVRHVNFTYGAP